MRSVLNVTTAASTTNLTTLAQLKTDLGLGDSLDTFYQRVIDLASDEICVYLGRDWSDSGGISFGRETVQETFYDVSMPLELKLGRFPIASITSVVENSRTTARLVTGSDGAITATETTFASAGASFTDSYVGKAITVTGAGASGADLTTTIASVTDDTTIELTDAASTTVASANYEIDNPAFNYVIKKANGLLYKVVGSALSQFSGNIITVNYISGWLLPGETGRNLPYGIEDACILLCQYKISQLQSSASFGSGLKSVDIDDFGKVEFADSSSSSGGQNSMPFDVRSMLARYLQPTFA